MSSADPRRRRVVTELSMLDVRDRLVLRDVDRFRLLTGWQLQALHFGDGAHAGRAARRALLRLVKARLLVRLQRRVGGIRAGSDGYVYALSATAARLLHPEQARRRPTEVRDGFLRHTLAIGDVYVDVARQYQQGRISGLQVQTEPETWRRLASGGGVDWLKPDLLVATETAGVEYHSFVEVDRGTEHSPAILRKLRQYDLAYRLGTPGFTSDLFPRVVWVVPDEHRLTWLAGLVRRTSGMTGDLFVVCLMQHAASVLAGLETTV